MSTVRAPSEGIYRRLTVRMYGDDRFMQLSPVQPSGQSLWIYLLTGPHTGPLPGVFVVGRAALAETLEWSSEAFEKAFQEVIGEGLAEFEPKTRMWFIQNAIRHNVPHNPNVVKSWRTHWLLLPECELRERIFSHFAAALYEVSEAFGNAFEKACGKAFDKPSAKASGNEPPKQEQEAGSRKQEKKSPSNASKGSVHRFPPGFDVFWEAYPRKVAKNDAAKAFAKVKPDAELLARMLAAIEVQRAGESWRKDGGKFIPHPATWLNGARWQDEAPAAAANERQAMFNGGV